MSNNKPVIFIVGPTATGKSEVAYLLACDLGAEIISCDSMAVYKEPRIITSKPDLRMLDGVRHHFIGIASVTETYNVFDYYRLASGKTIELCDKGKPVLVCGGSGLYMKAICDGMFEGPSKNEDLRKELEKRAQKEGNESLHRELKAVDSDTAAKVSVNDLKRIIRALEVYHETGIPISQKQRQAEGLCGRIPIKAFGLRFRREVLYERINQRTEQMFVDGAVPEVRELMKLNLSITARRIIGINEISAYLNGVISEQEAKELMKKNTRNFAKRQMTWFRKDKRIEWIDVDNLSAEQVKEKILEKAGEL